MFINVWNYSQGAKVPLSKEALMAHIAQKGSEEMVKLVVPNRTWNKQFGA